MKHISKRPDVEHHLFAELLSADGDDEPKAERLGTTSARSIDAQRPDNPGKAAPVDAASHFPGRAQAQAGSATAGASAISTVSAAAFCRRERARNGTASAEMPAPSRYDGA
jgi:hypothetical protein